MSANLQWINFVPILYVLITLISILFLTKGNGLLTRVKLKNPGLLVNCSENEIKVFDYFRVQFYLDNFKHYDEIYYMQGQVMDIEKKVGRDTTGGVSKYTRYKILLQDNTEITLYSADCVNLRMYDHSLTFFTKNKRGQYFCIKSVNQEEFYQKYNQMFGTNI